MSKIIGGVFVLLALTMGGFFVYQQTTSNPEDCATCKTVKDISDGDQGCCSSGCCSSTMTAAKPSGCCSEGSCCDSSTPASKSSCCESSTTASKSSCCEGGSCPSGSCCDSAKPNFTGTPSANTVFVVNPDGSIQQQ